MDIVLAKLAQTQHRSGHGPGGRRKVGDGWMSTEDREPRFAPILGAAVISSWGDLPHDVQQRLFEAAITLGHRGERDESLREELARFLHERRKPAPRGN